MKHFLQSLTLTLTLSACVSADPALVARAVGATLTAVVTPTPIVVVVTVAGGVPIPSVTPDVSVQQTLAAATETLAAESGTALATGGSETRPYTPTVTDTPVPTALLPPAPSATPAPTETTPLPLGNLLYDDDFTQPRLWNLSEDSEKRTAIADGQMSITLKVPDRFTFIYNLTRRARDFYATVTGAAAECRFRDRYGLLFRVQDGSNYYQYEVDCDGRYRLSKVVEGTLTPLQDWTPHDAIRSGGGVANDLAVLADGKTIEVYANGQWLRQVSDELYAEGGFGLYAGSGASETYVAAFDNLRVWNIKK